MDYILEPKSFIDTYTSYNYYTNINFTIIYSLFLFLFIIYEYIHKSPSLH